MKWVKPRLRIDFFFFSFVFLSLHIIFSFPMCHLHVDCIFHFLWCNSFPGNWRPCTGRVRWGARWLCISVVQHCGTFHALWTSGVHIYTFTNYAAHTYTHILCAFPLKTKVVHFAPPPIISPQSYLNVLILYQWLLVYIIIHMHYQLHFDYLRGEQSNFR